MKKHARRKGLIKEPVDSDRIRRLPAQFEPLDRRLLYEKHLCGMTHEQIALYVLLALASDREGLSYYSDARITHLLRISEHELRRTRQGLIHKQFLLYRKPMYQLLDLPQGPKEDPRQSFTPSVLVMNPNKGFRVYRQLINGQITWCLLDPEGKPVDEVRKYLDLLGAPGALARYPQDLCLRPALCVPLDG